MDLVGFVVVSLFEATVEKSMIGASVEKSSIRGCRAAGPVASSEFGVAASSEADDDSVDWRCGPLVEMKKIQKLEMIFKRLNHWPNLAGTNRGGKVVLSWSWILSR